MPRAKTMKRNAYIVLIITIVSIALVLLISYRILFYLPLSQDIIGTWDTIELTGIPSDVKKVSMTFNRDKSINVVRNKDDDTTTESSGSYKLKSETIEIKLDYVPEIFKYQYESGVLKFDMGHGRSIKMTKTSQTNK